MRKRALGILGLLVVLTASGCRGIPVYVDGINDPQLARPCKYALARTNKEASGGDLQFKEFADQVTRVLGALGYQRVKLDDAEQVIVLDYGVGEATTKQHFYSVPVYGQTGGGVSSFSASTWSPSGGSAFTSGTVSSMPTYGVVGSSLHSREETTYPCRLRLTARCKDDSDADGNRRVAWTTTARSVGKSSDLRVVFPIMLAASRLHIGKNTGRAIGHRFHLSDPAVEFVRGLGPDPGDDP